MLSGFPLAYQHAPRIFFFFLAGSRQQTFRGYGSATKHALFYGLVAAVVSNGCWALLFLVSELPPKDFNIKVTAVPAQPQPAYYR